MIYYAIRHKASGQLMPQFQHNRGYSHWNPNNPDKPLARELGFPRLLTDRKKAERCIIQWNCNPNGKITTSRGGMYGEEVDVYNDIKPDGRKKEDLEVVKVELRIR